MGRKWWIFLAGIVALWAVVMYLLVWPVPIEPAKWNPPPAPPLTGDYLVNDRLAAVALLGEGLGVGPEDVALDGGGNIYGGYVDGIIRVMRPDGTQPAVFAVTGGRPLGLAFDGQGRLIVADAVEGLVRVSKAGVVDVLATAAGGKALGFTDDVDVDEDGTIYFSDASYKFGIEDYMLDLLEHQPNGRLLAYYPDTQKTEVLLDGLYFANGVAVSEDQMSVLVVETGKYRVQRYWLRGPNRGQAEVFIDNLPGFPDGVSRGSRGIYWIALASPRDPMLDYLLAHPTLRAMLLRLPAAMRPGIKHYSFVLGVNDQGKVIYNLQDPEGHFAPITSVEEHEGMLYLGSLTADAIGRVPVPGRAE